MKPNWRLTATIDRLISNILAACKVLSEEGHVSLAGQLRRDRDHLVYWQEHGGLIVKGNKQNIQLEDGDGWLIDENSVGARWTLECCGCGRRHQFELTPAGPGAYQITITEHVKGGGLI